MKSWVEISGQRIKQNYERLRRVAGSDLDVLAVVKANAYGHGAAVCSVLLAEAGAKWLGVTDAAEGVEIREALSGAGLPLDQQPRILVMCGSLPEDADLILRNDLTPTVWTEEQVAWMSEAVLSSGRQQPLPVHLEIDTGMARQGVEFGPSLDRLLDRLSQESSHLHLDGVMTHFASAEVAGSPQTADQCLRFEAALGSIATSGFKPSWIHAGNTSTEDNSTSFRSPVDASHTGTLPRKQDLLLWLSRISAPFGARGMIRSGLGLYGYCLPINRSGLKTKLSALTGFVQPALQWKTRVLSTREIGPGSTIGYNGTFRARKAMRLALLPVGYADGLRRELSSSDSRTGGWVILRGRRAPILGRVSMNLTVVDITSIPGVSIGDEVLLLGPGITAEEHARLAGTIPYEILCGVRPDRYIPSSRVPA